MKIIYLHQYFKTKEEGGSLRSFFVAKAMVEAGFDVEMITAHNQKKYLYKEIEGIKVHYLPVYYDNTLGTFRRILAFVSFVWRCYRKASHLKRQTPNTPCVCYATSTPLTIGWVALWLKRWQNIPYVFEVRDLWPEAPIEMGVIKLPLIQRRLYALEKKIYQKASKIIALSPGMQASIQRKAPHREVTMASNMADCDFFAPNYSPSSLFVISYIGTIGKANHLEYLLQVAQLAAQRQLAQIEFWIVGEGKALADIRLQAKTLSNVKFYGKVNKHQIKQLLAQSQATYTSFLAKPVLATCSPNKFFDSLAAGKLTIVNTKGWLKEVVEKNRCGFYADPEKPEDFLAQLMPFLQDQVLLQDYQQNARKVAEKDFEKGDITKKIVEVVRACFDNLAKRTEF